MARAIWTGLFLGTLALPASASGVIEVRIDVLPGESKNIIDRDAAGAIAVAVLGSPNLDARSFDPASLRFAGAPIVKNDRGETHEIEGTTLEGAQFLGRDDVRTLRSVLREVPDSVDKAPSMAAASPAPPLKRDPGPSIESRSTGGITILDGAPASPYPPTISVSGINGVVTKLRVSLNALSHNCYEDLDLLLVGPTGQSATLMSDVGGCNNTVFPVTLTFDDFAPTAIASGVIAGTGSYRPFDFGGGDVCWDANGLSIACAGTGQDGELQKGVSVDPRFTDNADGTVTDNLTGLIWLKDVDCLGFKTWPIA